MDEKDGRKQKKTNSLEENHNTANRAKNSAHRPSRNHHLPAPKPHASRDPSPDQRHRSRREVLQSHKPKSWELVESKTSRDHSDQQLVDSARNLSVDSGKRRPSSAGKWKNVANYIEVSDRIKKSAAHKPPLPRDLSLQDYGDGEKDLPRDKRSGSVPTGQNIKKVNQEYEQIFHKGKEEYY